MASSSRSPNILRQRHASRAHYHSGIPSLCGSSSLCSPSDAIECYAIYLSNRSWHKRYLSIWQSSCRTTMAFQVALFSTLQRRHASYPRRLKTYLLLLLLLRQRTCLRPHKWHQISWRLSRLRCSSLVLQEDVLWQAKRQPLVCLSVSRARSITVCHTCRWQRRKIWCDCSALRRPSTQLVPPSTRAVHASCCAH